MPVRRVQSNVTSNKLVITALEFLMKVADKDKDIENVKHDNETSDVDLRPPVNTRKIVVTWFCGYE